jgi:hypothetical protein
MLLVAVALMLAATSCVGGNNGSGGDSLRAVRVVGAVLVQTQGGDSRPLRRGNQVEPGSVLTTGKDARVRLEGASNRAVELAGDTRATIVAADHVSLDLGAALAETGKGRFAFDTGGVGVRVSDGAARLDRRLGRLRVGVYKGSAVVDLLGRSVDVPAYRQQDFAGGVPLDRDPTPLALDDRDPWDRSLLGDVLELDRGLGQFVRGFNSEFGDPAPAPVFFTAFVPGTKVEAAAELAPQDVTAADTLVGLVFAQQLAARAGNDARVTRDFVGMTAEFKQGATWGLIAKERGLELRLLLPAVLDAIRRGTTPASTPGGSGGGGGGSGGGGGGQPTSRPTTKPKPTPTGSPTGPGPTPTPTPCSILDRLLGNCSGTADASSSGAGGGGGATNCSVVAVLIDPDC